ncbi:hypothetical protein JHK85_009938 [Glycine max]|nr:hypothetical protein JHK85_009938 [Glycine max]
MLNIFWPPTGAFLRHVLDNSFDGWIALFFVVIFAFSISFKGIQTLAGLASSSFLKSLL